jgi:hypothetical protein
MASSFLVSLVLLFATLSLAVAGLEFDREFHRVPLSPDRGNVAGAPRVAEIEPQHRQLAEVCIFVYFVLFSSSLAITHFVCHIFLSLCSFFVSFAAVNLLLLFYFISFFV